MSIGLVKDRRFFEFMLICIVLGMSCVAAQLGAHKLLVLNLFFLPIILSGYYLGRTSACILALLAALAVTIVTALDPSALSTTFTPMLGVMALAVWAAVLALTALLVGTLCDERATAVTELHEAYVGVVEVLSKYLQGGHPKSKARSIRVAELSQFVAYEMNLSRKQIDDIRVGALLYDLGNVEITTKLITKVVDTLESSPNSPRVHTFAGLDLVHSLGAVLHGAVPLLISQDEQVDEHITGIQGLPTMELPLGARIIRAVRAYDVLTSSGSGVKGATQQAAIDELRDDKGGEYDPVVLKAIERVVRRASTAESRPVMV